LVLADFLTAGFFRAAAGFVSTVEIAYAGKRVSARSVLGVMDADLSHPPEALPRMLDALDRFQADLVIGSRYIRGGGTKNWPFVRRAMSRFACLIARPLTAARDATSGYFLIRRHASEEVTIQARGFKICLELLVRGRIRTIVEVPYEFSDRAAGESKMSWREASAESVVFPVPDSPKNTAVSPSGPRLAEQCMVMTPWAGSR